MKTNEIRERYLTFFERKGATRVPSDSLVPTNDKSLLFTGAGMNQFKDQFMGIGEITYRSATSCQKCLRTGDLENVGVTAAHQSFFEMLGNFSFGDYFKKEAITWAWEFLTGELQISTERLSVSVFLDDDEAYGIWENEIGVPTERIYRFDEHENFWPAGAPSNGPNGVCGPCSEIFYDFGEEYGCGESGCDPSCDCDRYVEVWNLVFTQFNRVGVNELEPLPQKNIDTGMGLERISAVMQGVYSNFETDTFQEIIGKISEVLGVPYNTDDPSSRKLRRIADHIRAVTFLIGDGVRPGNEGRGYVERRLLRIALKDGMSLGRETPFLHQIVSTVAEVMGDAYPELKAQAANTAKIVETEEISFLKSAVEGEELARKKIADVKASGSTVFPGEYGWYLYGTKGYPVEFLEELLAAEGLTLDQDAFDAERDADKKRSQEGSNIAAEIFQTGPLGEVKAQFSPTVFTGYDHSSSDVTVDFLICGEWDVETQSTVERLTAGEDGLILLNQTPFYGESGGQIGDQGTIRSDGWSATVVDTQKIDGYFLHKVHVDQGTIKVGDAATATVSLDHRENTARHHTATHLLHAALRNRLGGHVAQAGSLVAPNHLRFDFTHFEEVDWSAIEHIDEEVNARIQEDIPVTIFETSIQEAKELGAMMLFGEKYGDVVRVVKVGEASTELCGGIHIESTGRIGLFKIVSETSVGSGTRRIEAVTGPKAIEWLRNRERMVNHLAGIFATSPDQLVERVEKLQDDHRLQKSELNQLKKKMAESSAGNLGDQVQELAGEQVVFEAIDNMSVDQLRSMMDDLIKDKGVGAVCLASAPEDRAVFIIGVHDRLIERGVRAGDLAKAVGGAAGGGGGGRPQMAQAGGSGPESLQTGLDAFSEAFVAALSSGTPG
jgi:alanyl-tRNA synthetase